MGRIVERQLCPNSLIPAVQEIGLDGKLILKAGLDELENLHTKAQARLRRLLDFPLHRGSLRL